MADDDDRDDGIVDEDTFLDDTDKVLQLSKAYCGVRLKGKEKKALLSEKEFKKIVSGCGNVRLFEPLVGCYLDTNALYSFGVFVLQGRCFSMR
ncbi:hypothetical protein PsorP6_017610 [Peronosclerospora sorghi]|uniref:Uncharacterized protein n=1 Tax=Peronosclerospora sorghi TaxID=230839 RepID=A0ACC0WPS2_9STRA|nr:hypothetical protein PsorP6_017610 [Peronosclerospora sorghi]